MLVALALVALLTAVALAYWELVVAEGVHLGPRIVTLLYDLTARRYDAIKQFDAAYEEWFIGEPLAQALAHLPAPSVLDVATGTGRAPLTLLRQAGFQGRVIGLDSSRLMLTQAARNTRDLADRLTLLWLEAPPLPFEDSAFDAVMCMESQFIEGGCGGGPDTVPSDPAKKAKHLEQTRAWWRDRDKGHADRFRKKLVELYGEQRAAQVQYAEAFEICEYGRRPSREELKKLFPLFE